MTRPRRSLRRNHSLVVALYVNAALLFALLAVLLSRGGGLNSAAMAAPNPFPPIAGGGALYLMPGQLTAQTWGCYLMDTDAQTLLVYEYFRGGDGLKLVAARNFRYDRQLKDYNTKPEPAWVQHNVEVERAGVRGREPNGAARPEGDQAPAAQEPTIITPAAPGAPGTPGGTAPQTPPTGPAEQSGGGAASPDGK